VQAHSGTLHSVSLTHVTTPLLVPAWEAELEHPEVVDYYLAKELTHESAR